MPAGRAEPDRQLLDPPADRRLRRVAPRLADRALGDLALHHPRPEGREKKYAIPFIFATIGLFVLGAYMALLSYPHALGFFKSVGGVDLRAEYTASNYLGLITLLMIAFGVTFEFPVVLVSLELAGVLKSAQLARWRRIAIVVIVIFAAVVTPSSDPFSMLAMAVPMLVFYEASIIIGKALKK